MFPKMLRLSTYYQMATRINRCTRQTRHGHVYVKFCVLLITIKFILKRVTDQIINTGLSDS